MSGNTFDTHLELANIQGLVVSGYDSRPVAAYAVFTLTDDVAAARRWLRGLLDRLQFGDFLTTPRLEQPLLKEICLNVAFTYAGLQKLGVGQETLGGLHESFRAGMASPHKSRQLGDDGKSSPEHWEWGGPKSPVHGILCVFAGKRPEEGGAPLTAETVPEEEERVKAALVRELLPENGVALVKFLPTHCSLPHELRKEHFGFRDGISNPAIEGLPGTSNRHDPLPSGELVLGYDNAYGKLPLTPRVPARQDPERLLPESKDSPDFRDFGKNGSYLVFRQISQNVPEFWKFMHSAAAALPDGRTPVWLASRMVGRWPDGTPVTLSPTSDSPDVVDDRNDFLFGDNEDSYGARCPIGSHIRRTNPRDTTLPLPHDPLVSIWPQFEETVQTRIDNVNRHRIIRRGRPYGEPLHPELDPAQMLEEKEPKPRGLYFLCFNTNLRRQFEFVQSTWVNSPAFAGLSNDPDPLLAASRQVPYPANRFTLQGSPGCPTRVVRGVPRFTEVVGGAYFLMPGRAAIAYLASLTDDSDARRV